MKWFGNSDEARKVWCGLGNLLMMTLMVSSVVQIITCEPCWLIIEQFATLFGRSTTEEDALYFRSLYRFPGAAITYYYQKDMINDWQTNFEDWAKPVGMLAFSRTDNDPKLVDDVLQNPSIKHYEGLKAKEYQCANPDASCSICFKLFSDEDDQNQDILQLPCHETHVFDK